MPDRKSEVGLKIYRWLGIIVLVLIAATYFLAWSAALACPYSLNYEGPMLWESAQLASFNNIYAVSQLLHEPWNVTIYPPLYMMLGAVLVKIFGLTYIPLRLFDMLCTAALGVVAYRLFVLTGCSRTASIVGLVFFFSFATVQSQSLEARPDMLVILCSVSMLERFVSTRLKVGDGDDSLKQYASTLLMAVIAFMVKQQAIVFIVAIALFLIINGSGKLALKFAAAWLACISLLFGLIQLVCGGFLESITLLAAVHSDRRVLLSNIASLGVNLIPVCVGLMFAPCGVFLMKKVNGVQQLPLVLLLVSSLVVSFSMGIPASSTHHIISTIFALSWWIGMTVNVMPYWSGILVVLVAGIGLQKLSEFGLYEPQLLVYGRQSEHVLKEMHLAGKLVLTDDPYINYLTDSKPVMEDCATFLNVWAARDSKISELTAPLDERRYAAVIINSVDADNNGGLIWWPQPVVAAIRRNYRQSGKLNCSGWELSVFLPEERKSK